MGGLFIEIWRPDDMGELESYTLPSKNTQHERNRSRTSGLCSF